MADKREEFFIQYYKSCFNRLKYYAYSVLRDWDRAEEAVQDVFHTAWRRIDSFMASPAPEGWLVTTLKYTLKNIQRSDQLSAKLFISIAETGELTVPAPPEAEVDVEGICQSLLSKEDYYLLRRWALDHATCGEIAQELNISLWACQKRMQRLMKKLRKHFQIE